MAGSVLTESETSNLVAFSRSGCFGLNSNRPLNGLTIEETIEEFSMDPRRPSGPGDFHPESLTDSGLDTLASSGSCHRLKAAAFR